METVDVTELQKWVMERPVFIDARAPGEFAQGHLPGAVNAPILNDEERALVGTCYKQEGQEAAIRLGHELVSGQNRDQKIQKWVHILENNPNTFLMCFRGGLRSKIMQTWLQEIGYSRPRVAGGYKACRQLLLDNLQQMSQTTTLFIVSGPTGSAKTHFLKRIESFWPQVDLEHHAAHRGSAFGRMDLPQPSQAVFENHVIFDLLREQQKYADAPLPLAVEDESRLIGRLALPDLLFDQMRQSPLIWLEVDITTRVENIFQDYILQTALGGGEDQAGLNVFAKYKKALMDIQRRLGGARTAVVMQQILDSEQSWLKTRDLESNKVWIQSLLKDYYDPMYLSSLERRQPRVFYRGSTEGAVAALLDFKKNNKATPVSKKANTV